MPADRVRWVKWWAAVVLLIGISFGCAAGPDPSVRPFASDPTAVSAHRIDHVPFVPGDPGACGPAALASLLAYWGDPVPVDAIARALARPSLAGVLPLDLARFAADRVSNLTATTGSIDWLQDEIRRDHPVMAFLDLGIGPWRRGHFVVVIGYREASRGLLLYSGRQPDAVMSYARFVRAWKRGGFWALAHLPSDAGLRSPFRVEDQRVGVQHVEPLRREGPRERG